MGGARREPVVPNEDQSAFRSIPRTSAVALAQAEPLETESGRRT